VGSTEKKKKKCYCRIDTVCTVHLALQIVIHRYYDIIRNATRPQQNTFTSPRNGALPHIKSEYATSYRKGNPFGVRSICNIHHDPSNRVSHRAMHVATSFTPSNLARGFATHTVDAPWGRECEGRGCWGAG